MLFFESVTWIQIDYGNITSNRTKEHQLRALITTGGTESNHNDYSSHIHMHESSHTQRVYILRGVQRRRHSTLESGG